MIYDYIVYINELCASLEPLYLNPRMTNIQYRNAVENDIDYLLWLRKHTMENHLLKSGISLSLKEHLSRVNYLFGQSKIILLDGQDIGLLKLDEKENSVEIVQVQIDPKFQGKGIGKKIIKSVLENSKNHKKIFLSVLKKIQPKNCISE